MNSVMKQAVLKHYGSVKEAAYALGEVDPSLMMREFDAGKFARVNEGDDDLLGAIAHALMAAFGRCDPKAMALRELREAKERLDRAMNIVERIA